MKLCPHEPWKFKQSTKIWPPRILIIPQYMFCHEWNHNPLGFSWELCWLCSLQWTRTKYHMVDWIYAIILENWYNLISEVLGDLNIINEVQGDLTLILLLVTTNNTSSKQISSGKNKYCLYTIIHSVWTQFLGHAYLIGKLHIYKFASYICSVYLS